MFISLAVSNAGVNPVSSNMGPRFMSKIRMVENASPMNTLSMKRGIYMARKKRIDLFFP